MNKIMGRLKNKKLKPAHKIILGFVSVILIGSFLLCLPISSKEGKWLSYFDSLFVSLSAVCVVGLTPLSPAVHFSIFGQIILFFLIQIGGLGFMTLTTFIMMLAGKKITLKDRIALREALNHETTKGIVKLVKHIFILTFIIELIGSLILMPVFIIDNGAIGVWQAIFTSVSAFCNAGFDLFGIEGNEFIGLSGYTSNIIVSLTISTLVIIGSIGFIVIMDTIKNKGRFSKLTLQSRIVLTTTLVLILVGWVGFFSFEYTNKATLGDKSFATKLLASFFQSVNCRTSGFTTINNALLTEPSKAIRDLFMLIGASPGSTGGGIKTTTVAVLFFTLGCAFRNNDSITIGKKSVNSKIVLKSIAILLFALASIFISLILLLTTEAENAGLAFLGFNGYQNMLHLSVSAFGNAGVYSEIVPFISTGGRIVLLISMFMGRIGIITMGFLFYSKNTQLIRYPEGNIIVG